MDTYRIHDMLEDISEAASTELAKGTEKTSTKEFGEVVDMIKDLSEAEKNKWQSCYYKSIVEAMDKAEYGKDYDWSGPDEDRMGYPMRDSRGRYTSRRGYDRMMPDMDMPEMRMSYSNGAYGGGTRGMSSSRYGYSYDKYMHDRAHYSTTDPEDRQERMKMMEDYTQDLMSSISDIMEDVSPEEKAVLKNRLNKLVSTMQ